jgi:hypothetical protein
VPPPSDRRRRHGSGRQSSAPGPGISRLRGGGSVRGGANVTRWSEGLAHVTSRLVPGTAHAMAIYYDVRDELLSFLRKALGVA